MRRLLRVALAALVLSVGACATLSPADRARAEQVVVASRPTAVDCDRPNACAQPSSLRELGTQAFAQSTPATPRHFALLLDYGQDALLARVNLIRAASTSVDVQTYIFDEDDAGHMILDELLGAARRGVRVRVLVDQLSALKNVETLASLAAAHANFEMRIYNPVLQRARISYPQYALAAACCWRRLNQRMHNKLLLVDGLVAITGGRNYQDSYYDWDPEYNFRDRDLFVGGPAVAAMAGSFDEYWDAQLTQRLEALADVGGMLVARGVPPMEHAPFELPDRVALMSRNADDTALVDSRLTAQALAVSSVEYISDLPGKHRRNQQRAEGEAPATRGLRELIEGAQREVLLQTPYLVLSPSAQDMFRAIHARPSPPRVLVSTNSLAATDAFITYALAYKYKRRFLRDFGFEIYEFKPFPADAPVDIEATGDVAISWAPDGTPVLTTAVGEPPSESLPVGGSGFGSFSGGGDGRRADGGRSAAPLGREYSALRWAQPGANRPVPLSRDGARFGLHAKSLVIDESIGVVGTHNFDPRGDNYNTEAAVVIDDVGFARALAASIRRDIAPENAWTIAPRDKPPLFSGLDYSLGKISEHLPLFDLWPTRYATSYEFVPSAACPLPLSPRDPGFRACYEPVGDFPEVSLGLRTLMTRIFIGFGAGLAPIL